MIITCPHCQTKYQVTYEAIGAAGRKVQCAHCQQAWQQDPLAAPEPEPEPEHRAAFEAIVEDALDEAMQAEEKAVAAETQPAPKKARPEKVSAKTSTKASKPAAPASSSKQQMAFTRRRSAIEADLPLARLRRTLRVVSVLLLIGLLATAFLGRVQVVQRFPAMAGVYEAIGLGVNVVGLDFSNVTTIHTKRGAQEVLLVSAQIVGMRSTPARVPSVVVTLLDEHGQALYEWSVTPSVPDLMAGERATFDTQLLQPPANAARVRLSFTEDAGLNRGATASAPPPQPKAHPDQHAATGASADHDTTPAAPVAAAEHPPTPEHH